MEGHFIVKIWTGEVGPAILACPGKCSLSLVWVELEFL